MSRPTEPPEEFLRREDNMGVRKGVSAASWTPLTTASKVSRSAGRLLDAGAFLIEEVRLVEVDQLGPGEHPDDPAERQEDAERDGLLARRRALTREDHRAHDAPRQEGREERRDD